MSPEPGLASWLQLALTPGLSGATVRRMLRRYGMPEAVLAQKRSELATLCPAQALAALDSDEVRQAVARALCWADESGHAIVTLADDAYPKALLEVSDPPTLLYLVGRPELLNRSSLAVVGSRNATAQGERNAESFARELSEAGITIVSGLALGIDGAAHRGALAGEGSTVAVLGTGIDIVYPRGNSGLAREIASRGLLISEFPLGTPPAAHHFPRRNRLISGLSQGVLVVEAALASGSLITARTALDQGRDVFAIPGSIHSPLSKGCHALIKSGAKLVECADDILSELKHGDISGPVRDATALPAPVDRLVESELLAHVGYDPVDVDSLCTRAGLSAEQVASQLLRLELDGHITALPGGFYQRLDKGARR